MTDEMSSALTRRQAMIEERASTLAQVAVREKQPWVRRLGGAPGDARAHKRWIRQVSVVAAYRDRYKIEAATPLGAKPTSERQEKDAELARRALLRASQIAAEVAATYPQERIQAVIHSPAR